MLGRRDPQGSFFEAQCWPHRVPEDSIYARMAAVRDVLFNDDDLAKMYCPYNGRRSIPPSLLCGVILLQFHDDVSDGEAVERTLYDLRWKVALGLPLDFPGFDPSSLVVFRKGIDLVSPVSAPGDPEVAKSAFQIDEVAGKATCPQGQTSTVFREVKDDAGRKVKQFVFDREVCVACPLFQRCL